MIYTPEILRVLGRDMGSQIRQSRNLGESLPTKCRRAFWAAAYLGKALWLGIRSMRSECLGSSVIYNGMKCIVSNRSNSQYPSLAGDGFYEEFCDRNEIKSAHSLREYWHRFNFGVSFYMGSWHGIDVNNRLYK